MNKVILIGNVGKDPEVRYTEGGIAVANFSFATSEKWKDKDTGDMREETEWHKITAWRGLATTIGNHVKKGAKLALEGKNKTNKWTAEDGTDRWTTEVVINRMEFLGRPPGAESSDQQQAPSPPQGDQFDDDIPF